MSVYYKVDSDEISHWIQGGDKNTVKHPEIPHLVLQFQEDWTSI